MAPAPPQAGAAAAEAGSKTRRRAAVAAGCALLLGALALTAVVQGWVGPGDQDRGFCADGQLVDASWFLTGDEPGEVSPEAAVAAYRQRQGELLRARPDPGSNTTFVEVVDAGGQVEATYQVLDTPRGWVVSSESGCRRAPD